MSQGVQVTANLRHSPSNPCQGALCYTRTTICSHPESFLKTSFPFHQCSKCNFECSKGAMHDHELVNSSKSHDSHMTCHVTSDRYTTCLQSSLAPVTRTLQSGEKKEKGEFLSNFYTSKFKFSCQTFSNCCEYVSKKTDSGEEGEARRRSKHTTVQVYIISINCVLIGGFFCVFVL